MSLPTLHTTAEVAESLRTTEDAIRRLLRRGDLAGIKKRNQWWVEESAVRAYLDSGRRAA